MLLNGQPVKMFQMGQRPQNLQNPSDSPPMRNLRMWLHHVPISFSVFIGKRICPLCHKKYFFFLPATVFETRTTATFPVLGPDIAVRQPGRRPAEAETETIVALIMNVLSLVRLLKVAL